MYVLLYRDDVVVLLHQLRRKIPFFSGHNKISSNCNGLSLYPVVMVSSGFSRTGESQIRNSEKKVKKSGQNPRPIRTSVRLREAASFVTEKKNKNPRATGREREKEKSVFAATRSSSTQVQTQFVLNHTYPKPV